MAYADVLTALADPTRRRLFEALHKQPRTVTELAKGRSVSRPAVSQHLRVLEAARLVNVEPRGNHRLYRVRRDGLDELRRYLQGFWSDALAAYSAGEPRRCPLHSAAEEPNARRADSEQLGGFRRYGRDDARKLPRRVGHHL